MPENTSSSSNKEQKSQQRDNQDAANQQVQRQVDQETEQGYRGLKTDPTPNEAYTVAGVTQPAPTPETDTGARQAAQARESEIADLATNPEPAPQQRRSNR